MPSALSEAEIYSTLIDALQRAEGCMTQLAYHRGDERWARAARCTYDLTAKIKELATTKMVFVPN